MLQVLVLSHKQETERELEFEPGFKTTKPTTRDLRSPARTALPTTDQLFNERASGNVLSQPQHACTP